MSYPKGTKVQINKKHHGARGSTGYVSRKAPERINGHTYWTVRLTGGKARGWTMLFAATQMDRI